MSMPFPQDACVATERERLLWANLEGPFWTIVYEHPGGRKSYGWMRDKPYTEGLPDDLHPDFLPKPAYRIKISKRVTAQKLERQKFGILGFWKGKKGAGR